MTGKQIIKLYKQSGWTVIRIRGSHYLMQKEGKVEVIPHHSQELPKGLEKHFLKILQEVK